jgi:hypothetical protein
MGGYSGEHKDSGSDDRPYTERAQLHGSKHPPEPVFTFHLFK